MRAVIITFTIILVSTLVIFNVFQYFRSERPITEVIITEQQELTPRKVEIRRGEEVRWVNRSGEVQLVTSIPEKSSNAHLLRQSTSSSGFHVGRVKVGKSRDMMFYETGNYIYVVEVPGTEKVMTGVITVKERE